MLTDVLGRLRAAGEMRRALPALIVLAVAVRLAVMLALPQVPVSDGEWYMERAAELARGLGYQEAGHPTAFWPVGYPALLAGSMLVAGPGLAGPLLANLVAAAGTVALIAWFARATGAGLLAGRVAALLYAIYPAAVLYAGVTASEVTATAVATLAFALMIAGREGGWQLPAAGVVFGLATLMRAQVMLFPIGAAVALVLAFPGYRWRAAVRAGVVVYLAMAAVVLPWTLRNERVLGVAVPVSTNGGVALFTGAYDGATGDWTGWERTPVWREATGVPYPERVARQVEVDRNLKAHAKAWIAAHPARWTALGLRKMGLLWLKDTDAFWSLQATYPAVRWTAVQAANQLFYLLLMLAALPCWWRGLAGVVRRDPAAAPLALLAVTPAFVTLTAFGFTGQTRYHFPAMPFVVLAAGWTLARLITSRAGAEAMAGHRAGEAHAPVLAARLGHEA